MPVLQKSNKRGNLESAYIVIALGISCLMVGVSLGIMISANTPNIPTVIEPGSMVSNPDSTVFESSGLYYVKSGSNGSVYMSTTNATAAIAMALSVGGVIYIRDGSYTVYPLSLPSDITIIGQSHNARLVLHDSANERMIENNDRLGGNQNIRISNLFVDGNKYRQSALGTTDKWGNAGCLDFRYVKNLTLDSLVIVNAWAAGIETTFCTNVFVTNNVIQESADDSIGINEGTVNAIVSGNILDQAGIGKSYGQPCGVEIQDGASHVAVSDNLVHNPLGDGIQVSSHLNANLSLDVSITGNVIESAHMDGVLIEGRTLDQPQRSISISGNVVRNATNNAIEVRYGQWVTISANVCNASYGRGIYVVNSNTIDVTGNVVVGGTTGISIFNVSGSTFVGNSISYGVTGFSALNVQLSSIACNLVFNGTGNGILISSSKLLGIKENTIFNQTQHGIFLDAQIDAFINVYGNNVYNNGLAGIEIMDTLSNSTIAGNVVLDNGRRLLGTQIGIAVNGDHNVIKDNDCRDTRSGASRTQSYGIYLYAGSNFNTVTENYLDNNAANNLVDAGSGNAVFSNIGYVTEISGVVIITGAVSTITVNHGLSAIPNTVTVTCNNTGAGLYAVTSITTTQFTITFANQPGTSGWKFYWHADA